MSITQTAKTRSTRAKIALVPFLTLGMFVGSLAVAGPAQANDDHDRDRDRIRGCTVTPEDPRDLRGNRVDFRIEVDCNEDRIVQIRQLRYEDERGPRRSDDFLGHSHFTVKVNDDDKKTIHSVDHVRNLDRRGDEEVYHLVSFRVKKDDGHWSDWSHWSDWKKSDVVEVRR